MTAGRTRNWAFVLYPESAPEDWREKLGDLHIQLLVSPLHKDLNPDDSEKKPHHHILLLFDGVKSYDQVEKITESLNCPHPQTINSLRGYARYLCHLDNPEKVQYSPDDVISYCGADYREICSLVSDKYKALEEMQDFCDEQGITSYKRLMQYARRERKDWYRVLCDSGTLVMMNYLKSSEWEAKFERLSDTDLGGAE